MDGFLDSPPLAPDGSIDPGRFTLHGIQRITNIAETFMTAAVTARQIASAAETRLLWTDQNVQRGIRPEVDPAPASLLAVGNGYPDPTLYIFDADNADDMVEKLLSGQRMFLNPLIWNFRPGTFEAYFDEPRRLVHVYAGRAFLPDTHHRHQAIVRAVQLWREAPDDYPEFNIDGQFSVEAYFMDPEDEAEYFFEKNQLGKRAERSRAYELTSQDVFAVTARRFAELTPSLHRNVNRVTDRLTARNPQVVTLSTLRTMVEAVLGEDAQPTATEIDGTAAGMSEFYEMLVGVRPELGVFTREERVQVRSALLSDQAVMMHGYASLMRQFIADVSSGDEQRKQWWSLALQSLGKERLVVAGEWQGDFFSRDNPLWRDVGVLQQTRSGKTAVSNTRQTRGVVGDVLWARLTEGTPRSDGVGGSPSSGEGND